MINKDYYPTPIDLINKMLTKIDITDYKNILEPSCGKGDIIDAIRNTFTYGRKPNIYGIEIEHQLRELSKDKCEIIGYDFLEFNNTMISFDLIIANFPFSDGVKHFLKAWELLGKGELVCLVNAETIKNPFSKDRKLIKTIIDDNKGSIEYIQNAFTDAERTTGVEVALITVSKTETKFDNIFKDFQEEFYNDFAHLDGEINQNEIVQGNNKVDHIIKLNLILKKESIKKRISENKYCYYKNIFNKSLEENGLIETKSNGTGIVDDIREDIFKLNQQCWAYFFRITPLRSKLTTKTYESFIQQYQSSKIDFTNENIKRVSDIIMLSAGKIQEENYIEIFDYLTKHREDNRVHVEGWKTNSGYKLNKRFIIPYGVKLDWCNKQIEGFTRDFRDKLNDIDKVFCNLSGKSFDTIQRASDWFENDGECEFFEIKAYKKRTVHFLVKKEYLKDLEEFNLLVCKSKRWIGF